jgi:hypothetical protein
LTAHFTGAGVEEDETAVSVDAIILAHSYPDHALGFKMGRQRNVRALIAHDGMEKKLRSCVLLQCSVSKAKSEDVSYGKTIEL